MLDELLDVLKYTPIWFGPALAVFFFCLFRFIFPTIIPTPEPHTPDFVGPFFRVLLPILAWFAAVAVVVVWIVAEVHKRSNRKLLDSQTSIDSIRAMSWQRFEQLISEAYRRQGYVARVVGSPSGDGGVDIELTRPGKTVLVQCKQWKAWKVSVNIVREMLGVVVNQGASKGIVVTSGRFTAEARRFAEESNPPIELVDGTALVVLIDSVHARPGSMTVGQKIPIPVSGAAVNQTPACPACGAAMVLRTAKRGPNSGSQFWGCANYPGCRGIRQL